MARKGIKSTKREMYEQKTKDFYTYMYYFLVVKPFTVAR